MISFFSTLLSGFIMRHNIWSTDYLYSETTSSIQSSYAVVGFAALHFRAAMPSFSCLQAGGGQFAK